MYFKAKSLIGNIYKNRNKEEYIKIIDFEYDSNHILYYKVMVLGTEKYYNIYYEDLIYEYKL